MDRRCRLKWQKEISHQETMVYVIVVERKDICKCKILLLKTISFFFLINLVLRIVDTEDHRRPVPIPAPGMGLRF